MPAPSLLVCHAGDCPRGLHSLPNSPVGKKAWAGIVSSDLATFHRALRRIQQRKRWTITQLVEKHSKFVIDDLLLDESNR